MVIIIYEQKCYFEGIPYSQTDPYDFICSYFFGFFFPFCFESGGFGPFSGGQDISSLLQAVRRGNPTAMMVSNENITNMSGLCEIS
jgi:hypothetical protein